MNKFKTGDKVKIPSAAFTKGKVGTVDYFNGCRYCVDFDNGWRGYYYPEELALIKDGKEEIFQLQKQLAEANAKLDRLHREYGEYLYFLRAPSMIDGFRIAAERIRAKKD